jgi:hypothetical protein
MMPIFTVIAFSALIVSIVSTFFAIKGKHQLYWIAAIGIYIFSLIAGFSIGQFTVGLTFVLLALASSYSFNLVKTKLHVTTCVGLGILIGVLMVFYVDDYWLFYPIKLLT